MLFRSQQGLGFPGYSATRRCAFLFEQLGKPEADSFYHSDQVIRSLYEPFLRDWHGAFASRLLVLRAEDLLDDTPGYTSTRAETRKKALDFLGLSSAAAASAEYSAFKVGSYAELHAGTRASSPEGYRMHAETHRLLSDFFAPHNARLAELLGDERFKWEHAVPVASGASA